MNVNFDVAISPRCHVPYSANFRVILIWHCTSLYGGNRRFNSCSKQELIRPARSEFYSIEMRRRSGLATPAIIGIINSSRIRLEKGRRNLAVFVLREGCPVFVYGYLSKDNQHLPLSPPLLLSLPLLLVTLRINA